MAEWLAIGVGPFHYFDVHLPNALYRGQKAELRGHYALAQAGELQIELVQPLGDGPSAFRDVFPEGASGSAFHHVMKTVGDWDAEMATLRASGAIAATEGNHNGIRFAYIDTRQRIGCMLELVEDGPFFRAINQTVREAALKWYGDDPVRPLVIATEHVSQETHA